MVLKKMALGIEKTDLWILLVALLDDKFVDWPQKSCHCLKLIPFQHHFKRKTPKKSF
jgi:hypothetical protein